MKIWIDILARVMGISEQDLIFKLKMVGVPLQDNETSIESDAIQAILQGKSLPKGSKKSLKRRRQVHPTHNQRDDLAAELGLQRHPTLSSENWRRLREHFIAEVVLVEKGDTRIAD